MLPQANNISRGKLIISILFTQSATSYNPSEIACNICFVITTLDDELPVVFFPKAG